MEKHEKFSFLIEEKFKGFRSQFFIEMFTTGFYMKAQEVADEEQALTWMKILQNQKCLQLAEAWNEG